jgi:hypothetical protein
MYYFSPKCVLVIFLHTRLVTLRVLLKLISSPNIAASLNSDFAEVLKGIRNPIFRLKNVSLFSYHNHQVPTLSQGHQIPSLNQCT